MVYVYIDGDDIGLRIENSFLNNNEEALRNINNEVSSLVTSITNHLTSLHCEIIFSGADGIICKSNKLELHKLKAVINEISKEIKFSIGAGTTLRDSYIALRYAKSHGKDRVAIYDSDFKLL